MKDGNQILVGMVTDGLPSENPHMAMSSPHIKIRKSSANDEYWGESRR
jgi:hypothetical protein